MFQNTTENGHTWTSFKSKTCVLELENNGYLGKSERLRQDISKIRSEDVNKKH